ncbi:MAG: LPS export ABC transporter permease LptF [Alphaproteobacteria bacterium]|nr:LPS export ABC transporter permease LptF [Alphaproteobacteria bacterium]
MGRITLYILRQILIGTILVTIGLTCVIWLSQSLRLVELIINKGLSIGGFLYLTMLLMPNFLTMITPIALFAVLLFTYNRLDADREMVVMRSAGLSQMALARPALLVAGGLTLFGYLLTIELGPASVKTFREMQWEIRNDISRVLLQEGTFNNIVDGVTVYVRSRTGEGELLDVLVHDTRKKDRDVTMMAERGALVRSDGGPRVLLINGNRQELIHNSGQLSLLYFDSYTVEMTNLENNDPRFRDARERPLGELFSVNAQEVGPVDFARFRVEAHHRLSSPLYHLAFAFVALVCLLSGSFSRHGMSGKVVLAIALMIAVEAAQLGVAGLVVKSLTLIPLIYVVPVLPILICLGLLIGQPRLPRLRGQTGEASK